MPEKNVSQPVHMDLRSASLALLAATLWGGTAVAVKYSADALPVIAVAAVRFGIASIFMMIWCPLVGVLCDYERAKHRSLPRPV